MMKGSLLETVCANSPRLEVFLEAVEMRYYILHELLPAISSFDRFLIYRPWADSNFLDRGSTL
jgi:hypothetical protein